jgi:serine/threonine protein kinase
MDTLLDRLIPLGDDKAIERLTEKDYRTLSELLNSYGHEQWAKRPRHFTLLRTIGAQQHIDAFDEDVWGKVTDISIPYCRENLPTVLGPHKRSEFFEKQRLVVTQNMDLERGVEGEHIFVQEPSQLQFSDRTPLGSGSGGQVWKAYSRVSLRFYAVKEISRAVTFSRDQNALDRFTKELANAKKVQHRHVARIVGSFTSPRHVGIIMSTVGDQDFASFLEGHLDADGKSLLRSFYGCLVSGLLAIHEGNIRHNDVKPHNIILRDNTVYFTDFGTSYDHSDEKKSTTNNTPAFFTRRYASPEVIKSKPKSSSSDIWSLGVIFLEMATRLHGKKVEDMRLFLDSRPAEAGSSYSEDVPGLRAWIEQLDSMGMDTLIAEDKLPLRWIIAMIMEDRFQRPTASALRDMIDADTTKARLTFMCNECRYELESEPTECVASTMGQSKLG